MKRFLLACLVVLLPSVAFAQAQQPGIHFSPWLSSSSALNNAVFITYSAGPPGYPFPSGWIIETALTDGSFRQEAWVEIESTVGGFWYPTSAATQALRVLIPADVDMGQGGYGAVAQYPLCYTDTSRPHIGVRTAGVDAYGNNLLQFIGSGPGVAPKDLTLGDFTRNCTFRMRFSVKWHAPTAIELPLADTPIPTNQTPAAERWP